MDIVAYDHVGLRVSDAERSLRFYARLGFVYLGADEDGDLEIGNRYGVRINLICNAARRATPHNVLQDEDVKHAGITHVAFVVPDLELVLQALAAQDIAITGGPHEAPRRRYAFVRDPDGNVVELNELSHPDAGVFERGLKA